MSKVLLKSSQSNSLLIGGAYASNRLSKKLIDRVEDFTEKALFITLTYDRNNYKNPAQLYREQSEQRHIRLFIRRLSNYLGVSLNGKWIRKMEFQNGGWIHFHLIIDSPKYIPHEHLNMLWGFGYTWINVAKWSKVKYFCKYISKKFEDVPPYLYMERMRSVKIIACSPNFWCLPKQNLGRPINTEYTKWAVFTPLVESFRDRTIVKSSTGSVTISKGIFEVMSELINLGSMVIGKEFEYLQLICSKSIIEKYILAHKISTCGRAGSPAPQVSSSLDNTVNSAHLDDLNFTADSEDAVKLSTSRLCGPDGVSEHRKKDSLARLEKRIVESINEDTLFCTWHFDYLCDSGVLQEVSYA